MSKQLNERGEGGVKNIIILLVVVYGIFVGVSIFKARATDREFQARIEEILKFAGAENNRFDIDDMVFQIGKKATALEIPIDIEKDIEVFEDGPNFRCQIEYKREVDLKLWTWSNDVKIDVAHAKY